MEGRANGSRQRKKAKHMSRVKQDLCSARHCGGAAGKYPEDSMIRRMLPGGRLPHVCVVGAGMAGLRCAEVLSHKGIKVTILEARDRIGGRIHQSEHLGRLVDLGPNWIHGTDHNPILDLAKATDTTTFHPEGESTAAIDETGQPMSDDKLTYHNEIMWGIIQSGFKYSNENSPSIPQSRSLSDFFMATIKDKGLDDSVSKVVIQLARIWGNFVGGAIERQSLKYLWLEECIDGGLATPTANTYKAILEHVAETVLSKVDLHLSTQVTKVISNDRLGADHPLSTAVCTNANDAPFLYDEVVVTAPLGYLKRNLSMFSPPLPSNLTRSISHLSYGRLEKVYLTFPRAYWSPLPTSDPKTPFFTHFLNPNYTPKLNPKAWNMDCASLADLPDGSAQPTLLFYMHGGCAEYITSLANGLSPSSQEYYDRLQPFFEPYYARLPNYDAASSDCIPKSILATNWQNDEFAGYGSYTNFQISHEDEAVLLDKDIETLRHGLPERNIWFAGEHTAPFVALGTVTGAYWSGETAARRILNAYGLADDEEKKEEAAIDQELMDGDGADKRVDAKNTALGAGVTGL
ncbi:MAG: hypothetical protein Q9191_003423 [Dirinaria sp. TL-2023a]